MYVKGIDFNDRRRNYRVADVNANRLVSTLNEVLSEPGIDTEILSKGKILDKSGNYHEIALEFYLRNPQLNWVSIIEYKLQPMPPNDGLFLIDSIHLFERPNIFTKEPTLHGVVSGYTDCPNTSAAIDKVNEVIQVITDLYRPSPEKTHLMQR